MNSFRPSSKADFMLVNFFSAASLRLRSCSMASLSRRSTGQSLLFDFGQVEVQCVLVTQLDPKLLVIGYRLAIDGQGHPVEAG